MSEVVVIVEGQTEQTFIRDVLAPEMGRQNIFISAALIGKPGQKGGNIRFTRALEDISLFLQQRPNTVVTTMFDYFGIDSKWPGRKIASEKTTASEKASFIEAATFDAVRRKLSKTDRLEQRFIPYIAMHEFEALLFSSPAILSEKIEVAQSSIDKIINECGEAEEINNNPKTAPSKRILKLRPAYKKILTGKSIAKATGIETMRCKCPHFNSWLERLSQI